ncbi:hypothetical protein GDO81_025800 [Engystomops pustulosus]|uniref:G-protein coupled receptors family 1 profile domain-containing protein n=1 Tax=Engystomops pustulosus TaxID=76066 RepID=A0AAV6YNG6_ENGPU|nr:hypothetical protein GDO81_025800 [Engystomops pustulosus]
MVEEILLFVMAYDRYVAICDPLHYHQILSRRNCSLITVGIWVVGFLNSFMVFSLLIHMSSCHSNVIHQFYCDAKSLTKTNCTTTQIFFVVFNTEILIFAGIPIMCTFISYGKIFSLIFKMKTKESRKKAFSTCSSHVTVVGIYYGAGFVGYFIPPYSDVLDSIFNIIYTTIVPLINPVIYSLQNSAIQSAWLGIFRGMCFGSRYIQSVRKFNSK